MCRRKLRVRVYGEGHGTDAFLEIKQKLNQVVKKRRCRDKLSVILGKLEAMQMGKFHGDDNPVYNEAYVLMEKYRLEPKTIIVYDREAFFANQEHNLRITFDSNLKYFAGRSDMKVFHENGKYFVAPTSQVVELKFNELVPSWLCSRLNAINLQIQRVSKYCFGVNFTDFDNALL